MRAIRDDDDFDDLEQPRHRTPATQPRREKRLAFEIALGIWLGGIALAVTSAAVWMLISWLTLSGINFSFN